MSANTGRRQLPTQIARGGSKPGAVLPIAAAAALALACVPTSVLFADRLWVWPALVTIAAVCGAGGLLRALPVPLLVVPLTQSAAFGAAMAWLFGAGSEGGPWQSLVAYRDLVADGVAGVRTATAPVAGTEEFLALLALVVFLGALLVETLAVGMGLAGLSGVVLLVMAIAPLGIQPSSSAVVLLAAPALGWVVLMAADSAVRLRSAAPTAQGRVGAGRSAGGAAGLAVIATLSSALVFSLVAPAANTPWLRTWWYSLSGTQAQGTAVDPFVSVEARLRSRSNAEMLRYRSEGGSTYLGMVTLEAFDGTTWQPYEPVPGVPLTSRSPDAVTGLEGPAVDVSVTALSNQYLPLPDGASSVTMATEDALWSWDPRTGDVISGGPAAAGAIYRVGTTSVPTSAEAFSGDRAALTGASRESRSLPADLVDPLAGIAAEVTAGASSDYDRAVALQRWFTESGGFTYSLDVPDAAGRSPLLAFLEDRVGFCQQFATAMAAVSRALGIPARVVVGFTGGAQQEDGAFVVSAADAHAWPELWFPSVGWVRFEPTPALGTAAVDPPAYTPAQPNQDNAAEPDPVPPPEQAPQPAEPQAGEEALGDGTEQPGLLGRLLGLLAAIAVIAGLLAVPRLVRTRRRVDRLARTRRGDTDAAWREIGDTAIDADLAWPAHGTLRQQAAVVSSGLASAQSPASAALPRILHDVEVARYAPAGAPAGGASSVIVVDEPGRSTAPSGTGDLAAETEAVVRAIAALPRPLGDRLFPRSLRRRHL